LLGLHSHQYRHPFGGSAGELCTQVEAALNDVQLVRSFSPIQGANERDRIFAALKGRPDHIKNSLSAQILGAKISQLDVPAISSQFNTALAARRVDLDNAERRNEEILRKVEETAKTLGVVQTASAFKSAADSHSTSLRAQFPSKSTQHGHQSPASKCAADI
jgi:hypothetical protein